MNKLHLFLFVSVIAVITLLQPARAPGAREGVVSAAPNSPPFLAHAAPDILKAGGKTTRVSVASDGTQANDLSHTPAISADGRFVAYVSYARTLVGDDTNTCDPWTVPGACPDVFVHDNETGRTVRVSIASDGAQANGISLDPKLSADGRYVTFWSFAGNLVPGDAVLCEDYYTGQPISCPDVFVHDLLTRRTTLISVSSGGAQGNAASAYPSISADGRYVLFSSNATNLVADDTALCLDHEGASYNCPDVFLHDRQTGHTEIVSISSNGVYGNGASHPIVLAAGGRLVFFVSEANNLVPGDGNGMPDAFVHDRQTGETVRINMMPGGGESPDGGGISSVSEDGRYVTFTAYDGAFVEGDDNNAWDVFIHDRQTGETRLVSLAPDGSPANHSSLDHAISPDGQFVAFMSHATNLIPGDTRSAGVVVRNMLTGEIWRASVASDGAPGNSSLYELAVSNGARYVAFSTDASNLVLDDSNETFDVFVHDSRTLALNYESGAQGSFFRVEGARYPPNEPAAVQINGHVLANVPVGAGGDVRFLLHTTFAGEGAYFVTLGADPGYTVAFVLDADQPLRAQEGEGPVVQVPAGIAFIEDIFLPLSHVSAARAPLPVGDTSRVSVDSDGTEANDYSGRQVISADGRYVAFWSTATNLVPDDTNEVWDIFVHDRQTTLTRRVTVASDGTQANGAADPEKISISADGRYVVFASEASNLVPEDTEDCPPYTQALSCGDIFVHDQLTEETSRVSVSSDGIQGNNSSNWPSITADGRYVAFVSHASNLVVGDTNDRSDIFVHDQQSGETTRVSVSSSGAQANNYSVKPSISADGRFVVFLSEASNLTAGDADLCTQSDGIPLSCIDVFVHDRHSGETTMVSVASDGTQANADSGQAVISSDGRYVAFSSAASNLVPGGDGAVGGLFLHDRQTGQTRLVSREAWSPSISNDGRHLAFVSALTVLVDDDVSNEPDIFVYDVETGAMTLVSLTWQDQQPYGLPFFSDPSISGDGRTVAFSSSSPYLVPGDTNHVDDVFVRDRGESP